MGYSRAGFEVVGVDIHPQPHYPFEFHQADAMTYPLDGFDVIHASPPCQAFSPLRNMWNAKEHADLVGATRARLEATRLPYAIENVPGAPLRDYIVLCGSAFGLGTGDAELRRHRLFEVNPWPLLVPPCAHGLRTSTTGVYGHRGNYSRRVRARVIGVYGGHGRDRRRVTAPQDFSTEARREAMGIDWMTGDELSQAIPPAYTEWIGRQLIAVVAERAA
jgi:DNA (cytosine-5)-methyltransferase 1